MKTNLSFKSYFLFASLFLSCSVFAYSQDISMEQTLEYINGKLGGKCSLDVSHGVINSLCRENGQVVREEQAPIHDLDINSIKYDAQYNIIYIDCKGGGKDKCDNREIFNIGPKSVYRGYSRISWEAHLDEKSAEGMKKALVHMMRLVLEPKYKSSEPFE
jgi:hypothetical protein